MKGTLLIFRPGQPLPDSQEIYGEPTLEMLKDAIGGGYLEIVPGFRTIAYAGVVMDCVAFCDEDGKHKAFSANNIATVAWDHALRRNGTGLLRPDGRPVDWLAGPIAVVFGDREFMKAL